MTKAELLAMLKDPEVAASLQGKPSDKEAEELFAPIEIEDGDTAKDLARKYNERLAKQKNWFEGQISGVKEDIKKEGEQKKAADRQAEVDAFLKKHPELAKNEALLDEVEPLYAKSGNLEEAYRKGCKILDLDPETAKPFEKKEEKKEAKEEKKEEPGKRSPFRTDTPAKEEPSQEEKKAEAPKSIREIASEKANTLAAEGKNPFRPVKEEA